MNRLEIVRLICTDNSELSTHHNYYKDTPVMILYMSANENYVVKNVGRDILFNGILIPTQYVGEKDLK